VGRGHKPDRQKVGQENGKRAVVDGRGGSGKEKKGNWE